jgi:hypothetical protein
MSLAIAAGLGLAPACVADDLTKPTTDDTKTDDSDFKAERWGTSDQPNGFAGDLNYALADLPAEGVADNKPWASNYWPTYHDSINYRWDGAGSKSATEKYEEAFGVSGVADAVSQYYGIDRYKGSRTACTSSSECDSSLGESCSKREGADEGVCIPTWWGICHAWAPLAVLHPEPQHEVEYNGVTFKVNDIKALMTIAFNSTQTKFVSQRCNVHPNDIARDAYGRPADENDECRDTNAGTMHVLVTNYLGVRGESFVYDRTLASEVWNQPLRSYEITMQEEIDARTANELLGVTSVGGTTTNDSGTVAKDAWHHVAPVAVNEGEGFTVVMSGSDDADLYVRFGGQPTTEAYDCRPYAGGSAEECALTVPAGVSEAFVSVRGYAASSDFEVRITAGGSVPNDYFFNDDADQFFHVKMRLDYITESHAETDGYFGDDQSYVRSDRYEYILELEDGKIIGGEYVGASKNTHPDFLWLPLDRRSFSIAGGKLSYEKIKMIYDQSLAPVDPGNGGGGSDGGFELVTETGTVAQYEWKQYGPFEVAEGGQIKAILTGTADADLYVRKGSAPTPTGYDCRPYKSGSNEECTLTGAGTYYVGVRGYASSSDFAVEIEYGSDGGSEPPIVEPPAEIEHINLQDTVAQGESKYYSLDVPAGQEIKIRTFADNDVDLYIQMGTQPTTSDYLMRAWTVSGNETITYTPSSSGTLHIMVHGYAGSDYTLRTE